MEHYEEQIQPSEAFTAGAKFSPGIRESQEVMASPRNSRVHGNASKSVFNRLFHDTEQRERRLAMERNRIMEEESKELTFHPKTNVKHDKKKGLKIGRRRVKSGEKRFCEQCMKDKISAFLPPDVDESEQLSAPSEMVEVSSKFDLSLGVVILELSWCLFASTLHVLSLLHDFPFVNLRLPPERNSMSNQELKVADEDNIDPGPLLDPFETFAALSVSK